MMRPAARRDVAADAGSVWRILTDLDRWPDWGPSVRSASTADGDPLAAGSRGTVTTVGGLRLPFVIDELTPGRSWSWTVAGVRATDHRVDPTVDGCRVTLAVPLFAAPYLVICRIAVRRIEELATR